MNETESGVRPDPRPLRVFLISAVLSAAGFFFLVVGDSGTAAWEKSRAELRELDTESAELVTENAALSQRLSDAQTLRLELEKNAREDLGYVRPHDVVFVLPADAGTTIPGTPRRK